MSLETYLDWDPQSGSIEEEIKPLKSSRILFSLYLSSRVGPLYLAVLYLQDPHPWVPLCSVVLQMQNAQIQRAECTKPFDIRGLDIREFWYPWGSWNQSSSVSKVLSIATDMRTLAAVSEVIMKDRRNHWAGAGLCLQLEKEEEGKKKITYPWDKGLANIFPFLLWYRQRRLKRQGRLDKDRQHKTSRNV